MTKLARKPSKRRPRTARCKGCKKVIAIKSKGRVPTYCGHSCKQRAYVNRRLSGPTVLLAQDIATAQVRAVIRSEIWDILVKQNVVSGSMPKPDKPTRSRAHLRVVRDDDP